MKLNTFILLVLSLLLLTQCRKDEQISTDPGIMLEFSLDTVLFDTIFTTQGSITKRMTVHNRNDRAIMISNIALVGGQISPYRINVDGASGTNFTDVELLANDSLFVFIEATLNASNQSNPFLIEDQIAFVTNGNEQDVLLLAYGQDAYFHFPDTIPGTSTVRTVFGIPFGIVAAEGANEVWPNDKPHVVFGYAVVDSLGRLELQPGTRVHFHNNSGMLIWRSGQLIANGTVNDRITFEGDRLEAIYDDLPGQWDRIWILDSDNASEFNHVEVKNSLVGIQAETAPWVLGLPDNPATLVLNNTNIQNCSAAGLLARNYPITSDNLLVANCGQSCIALQGGGAYSFAHTTVGNFWSFDIRQTPSFFITNLYQNALGDIEVRDITGATFRDGIIWGNNTDEFETNFDLMGSVSFNFSEYLIRSTLDLTGPEYSGINTNSSADPQWADPSEGDYHLTEQSISAIDKGLVPYSSSGDLDGLSTCAPAFSPDLGCYEFCN